VDAGFGGASPPHASSRYSFPVLRPSFAREFFRPPGGQTLGDAQVGTPNLGSMRVTMIT
jgi:hypothetical protein